MDTTLTVRDLFLPGEPLDPAEVLAGQNSLGNAVSWVVSLRPFPPAFPRMRGRELALVATEHLARLEPPTTLADVVRHLVTHDAAGMAVRGQVDQKAINAAQESDLPLLLLQPDAPLHDIEQAIMRVCALYQARREMLPTEEPGAWVEDLLAGRITSSAEAQSFARRQGVRLATHYAVAYVPAPAQAGDASPEEYWKALQELETRLHGEAKIARAVPLAHTWDGGLAMLLPQGAQERACTALEESGLACGIGREKPLLEAPASLEEAQLAALASTLLCGGRAVRYRDMAADRLLLLLYRDNLSALAGFVDDTLGPLLRHDASSPMTLLPTLESFVTHGGRLRETAADIFVHRNTLAYRLDRAAEVLGADLRDPRTRLAIELALRALPLVRDA